MKVKHTGARATDKQLDYINSLARRAGYRYTSQAIKDILGKNPINGLNRERASTVIDALKSQIDR